jgi:cation diffusion facilitator family transporter
MENTFVETRSEPSKAGKRVTIVGVFVNGFLIGFKFLAGILGHSQALIADGVHSISDLFTDIVVLLGLKMGRKAPDEKHPFGHGRIETLTSAVVGLALIVTALYLGIEACWNIYRHTEHHPTRLALFAAAASIILKEVLYRYTIRVGRRIKSPVIIANAWHHRSDALSSVAVLLGVTGAMIQPSWHILDSYAALVVSFLIIKVGLETVVDSLREFIDTAPPPETLEKITQCARSVNGVIDIHDVRARSTGGIYQMEVHIVVDGHLTVFEGHRIAKDVEHCLIREVEGVGRAIVHVDPLLKEK